MNCYSIEPRDELFVKGYGFLYLSKNMSKVIGKNISKNLSGNQELHAKKSGTDALKGERKKFSKT